MRLKKIILSFWQKKKIIGRASVFIVGLILFLYNIYQIPLVKNKIPYFNQQVLALRYQYLAKKLPPNSVQAKRFQAMAEALKNNSSEYHFQFGSLPPMSK